jgi:Rieske 2Fe-2S family protein
VAGPGPDTIVLPRLERTLPGVYYLDPEHYRRELDVFWFRRWLYACRAENVARARDYQVIEVGDQSILITRDLAGRLHAFHNTCRHRGSILCPEPQGRFVGASIVCPYHGWTYSLEGELLGARHQLPSADFRAEDHPLYRVAVDEWAGCVFVNLLGESAPPLREALGEIPATLASWPIEDLVVGHRITRVVECNWKIFWENFAECFHCPRVHPELCEIVPIYGRGLQNPAEDAGYVPPEGAAADAGLPGLAPGAVTWSLDGQTDLPHFPDLTETERRRGQTFGILRPGVFLVAHVDYARIVRVLPRGPERIELSTEWLFPASVVASPDFDRERATALGALVVEQDARICELNQRGLHCRRHDTGVLVPQEYGVHEFQSWVRRELDEPG